MKKILSLILTLFCVLSLVGCGRSMDDIIKNESSITGVVEEVYNNSILISIQTDAYPYGAYCDVSLDAENKDDMVDFNIGDEVIVYLPCQQPVVQVLVHFKKEIGLTAVDD